MPHNQTAPCDRGGKMVQEAGLLQGKTKKVFKAFRELRQPLRVTDHAILRFLERTGRIDRQAIEQEILGMLSPRTVADVAASDGQTFRCYDQSSDFTCVVDDRRIISLWRGR
jgi:hypothetical protein